MKIAVFENELHKVQLQFEIANRAFFNDALKIDFYVNTLGFKDIKEILKYDLVIVDISLSSNSDKDGYNFIMQIVKLEKPPKIVVLTGSSSVQSGLEERNLSYIPIIEKPIDPIDIYNKINEVMNPNKSN